MKNKICCIFNLGPHYRAPIFQLMDNELKCDFYFGDVKNSPIKLMDYNSLAGYKETTQNLKIPKTGFVWQTKVWKLIFKPYKHYIITGSPGSLSNWFIVIIARLLGKKTHAWTHGMKGDNTRFGTFIEKKFYKLCYSLLLYGNYSKKIMINEGFNEKKLVLIYNSLNYAKQLQIRKNLKISNIYENHFNNDYPVITYIGVIQKSKKVNLIVEALHKMQKQGITCNLCLIGEDIEGDLIKKLVEKYDLTENVWFYGPCYNETLIGDLLYNSDVCISPGIIGLTAIHALTYGVPVITSNLYTKHGPEFEAIEPGKTGDFFESENIDDLCLKIGLWINLEHSKRENVRSLAYQTIDEKYNPSFQLNILKKLTSN
jgi:glycosyltransferase involved in cell wall biosynthesis